jgi:hypothetical protein
MNPKEKAQYVEWFMVTKSDTQIQKHFSTTHHKTPPSRPSIQVWYKEFRETGSVLHKKGAGRSVVSDENVERICVVFISSPHKSILAATHELHVLHLTRHWVLTKTFASVCLQVASGAGNYARW